MSDDYAGFWLRVVAFIIDSIVLSVLHLLVIIPLYDSLLPSAAFDPDSTPPTVIQQLVAPDVSVLVWLLVGMWFNTLMETSRHQSSIGKQALEHGVTDAEGGCLSFPRSGLRTASKSLSAALWLVGYLGAAFTRRKQARHDLIAGP